MAGSHMLSATQDCPVILTILGHGLTANALAGHFAARAARAPIPRS